MRVDDLLVEVRDKNLNRVGVVTSQYLSGATFVLRYNAISTWSLTLPADHALTPTLQAPGSGIIVTYKGSVLLSGFTTWMNQVQTTDDVVGVIEFTGLDDSVILRDRLAYPKPDTASVTAQTVNYDVRSGACETVMKAYVNANMGPSAPTARKVASLTIDTDQGRGASVKGTARFDVLYELLASLADASNTAGTPIGFDVVQSGSGLVFKTYLPTDRSKSVRLDIANNRLTETTYSLAQPNTTRVIVGGSGDGTARTFLERTSTTSLSAETAWGRRIETFVDSRDSADSVALATAGDTALASDGKAQISASVKPSDDTAMIFGVDWFLGDTVTVVVGLYELSAVVTELGISISSDGVRLYGTIGEPKLLTYEAQILARQASLNNRLNTLERYK